LSIPAKTANRPGSEQPNENRSSIRFFVCHWLCQCGAT
jgi:hypothetical protein